MVSSWSLPSPELLGCHGQLLVVLISVQCASPECRVVGRVYPGWHSPKPELWAVPIGFVFGAYTWAFLLAVVAGCRLLTYLRLSRPSWGPVRAFGWCSPSICCLEAVAENIYLRIGAIANISPYEPLTIWDGSQHAWPIYNPVLFSLVWTTLTALRW